MVRAYLPQGVVPLHSVITDQAIHDGFLKTMTHVQTTRDIGWWNHNAVGICIIIRWLKIAFVFPGLVPLVFNVLGTIGLFHVYSFVCMFIG